MNSNSNINRRGLIIMLVFNIKVKTNIDHLIEVNRKPYRIKQLDTIKDELNTEKSKLDDLYKNPRFSDLWSKCDPLRSEKIIVAKVCNTYNVSNAWLKCYELLVEFDIMSTFKDHFIHFDNAAFPGSFILATNHLANVHSIKHEWYASSLMPDKGNVALEDTYSLHKKYPEHWLMSDCKADDKEVFKIDGNKICNRGDVLSKASQLAFYERLGGEVNLYTSDIGTDSTGDYNNQELIQARLNVGQILSGLLTLRQGGVFITKQYTVFEPITISVMYMASHFFEEFYLAKPYSSRKANSETYLVGKGFTSIGNITEHPYIKIMLDLIENWDTPQRGKKNVGITPIFWHKDYPEPYLNIVATAGARIAKTQIDKLKNDIEVCKKTLSGQEEAIQAYRKSFEPDIKQWYLRMQFKPIKLKDQLELIDAYKQL